MANPAPTINQINAFNATQGTTIDFNIIGGTELVRSNRIYIYDLSDNSLICTHLYISTESIHELPANTDSSIVYESGKSSADFVNGAQYYAQIQTYTDTAGTEGGSGLSVAKMFWCLVDPTLTITTIPSTISTTSYNVSATYTDTSASVVSNIIQQYQFNLYSATGSLLQSSGVVVGNGEQQGTSTAYDISYNFTGLSVGSSYYVVVDVTTTQGMSVSAQSGTFTVSIDTPTLGEATVVNNACDGYISVTSNLSSEYGGSGSGEIVSFETDSENVFSKLQVDLDPIQDLHGYDKPWAGGAGKNLFNKDNYQSFGGYLDSTTIVGNGNHTIVYMPCKPNTKYTASRKRTIANERFAMAWTKSVPAVGVSIYGQVGAANAGTVGELETVTITTGADAEYIALWAWWSSTVISEAKATLQIEESAVATSYEPYENICPITGWTGCEVDVAGVNLVNETQFVDDEWLNVSNGNISTGSTYIGRKATEEYQRCLPNVQYYFGAYADGVINTSPYALVVCWYDKNKTYINSISTNVSGFVFTSPTNAFYFRIGAVTKANTVCVNLSNASINGTYQPYNPNSAVYNITWQTEAGTVYGGTVDLVTGVLTVDRAIVDLGTLNWGIYNGKFTSILNPEPLRKTFGAINMLCSIYKTGVYGGSSSQGDGTVWLSASTSSQTLYVEDSRFSDATDFKSAMNGVQLVYELATPQTYQLTPQQIQTLLGQNNVWADCGDVEITYNIPITNLLVKRQDVADVSGAWLTLYSQPITQASDMDFTFIDFLNQYGKTYKYALVPLLTQTQSGVEVEVEGGYTVSDEVQSIFDGVFIADSTGSQKCKANVGYGNVDMNQVVGSITPIGAKYPVVITNSQNQYHNGSISGTIVPDDYYFNGNLSRIDMVNKRNELEQFLTNKRAKIIKDWNSNIWLVMITDNIGCNFNNNYGMGMVSFNANWIEVGDPTNQQDLQATGLINVGGV